MLLALPFSLNFDFGSLDVSLIHYSMYLSTSSFLAFWIFCATALARTDAPAPGFDLQDQFGKLHQVAFPKARVSVLTLADRAGSEQLEGWVRPLYERYRDTIDIHGVAKLDGVPPPCAGWCAPSSGGTWTTR